MAIDVGFSGASTDGFNFPSNINEIVNKSQVSGAFRNAANKFKPSDVQGHADNMGTMKSKMEELQTEAGGSGSFPDLDGLINDTGTKISNLTSDVVDHPFKEFDTGHDPFSGGLGLPQKPIQGIKGYSEHVEKQAPKILSTSSYASKVQQTQGVSNPCEAVEGAIGSLIGGFDDAMDALGYAIGTALSTVQSAVDEAVKAIQDGLKTITEAVNDFLNAAQSLVQDAVQKVDEVKQKVADEIGNLLDQINTGESLFSGFQLPSLNLDPCAALAFDNMDSPEAEDLKGEISQDTGFT